MEVVGPGIGKLLRARSRLLPVFVTLCKNTAWLVSSHSVLVLH